MFILGLPVVPDSQLPEFQLIIGTSANETSYIVEESGRILSAGVATSSSPANLILPTDLEVTSSGYAERMKGIRVRTTRGNSVYVLVDIRYPTFPPPKY